MGLRLYMNTTLRSWVRSVAIAVIATSVMLAFLIISAEEIPVLKNWLKSTFYHHWLGKGALAILLFIVTAFIFRKRGAIGLSGFIVAEAIIAALSVLAITAFFLLHALGVV